MYKSSNNINHNLYIEVMDSLHFYIYHLEETGLRSKKQQQEQKKKKPRTVMMKTKQKEMNILIEIFQD